MWSVPSLLLSGRPLRGTSKFQLAEVRPVEQEIDRGKRTLAGIYTSCRDPRFNVVLKKKLIGMKEGDFSSLEKPRSATYVSIL
jgi:hypothetical protein